MAEILTLKPEDEKSLHPEALKWFNAWRTEIQFEVPLEDFSGDDLNNFLSDDEKHEFMRLMNEIANGLATCMNIRDKASTDPLAKASTDLTVLTFEVNSLTAMHSIKLLLKKAYARKREEQRKQEERQRQQVEQAKEKQRREQKTAEEEGRWLAARNVVNPPTDDARRYLDKPGEYDEFMESTVKAVEVYMEKPKDYLDDDRTFDYRWYLKQIKDRKEEEQIRNDAQAQARAFRVRLAQGLEGIEKALSPKKEDPAVVFKRWCSNNGENRYLEEPLTEILASDVDKNRKWTQGYIPAAEAKLRQSIHEEMRDLILTQPTAAFFLLPAAHYVYRGLPCLDFNFAVFAVVTITVLAQAGHKVFNGYKFDFLTNLCEPRRLGFYQITVVPSESHFWQSVPLTILFALIDGNLQPPGTTILEQADQLTIYEVKNFEGNMCEIPTSFERYCRSLGSVEKMNEVQIIDERTAEILEPLRPLSISKKEGTSNKAKAFLLFSQSKRPSDPEVKILGIKAESAYRYYQAWKKAHGGSNNL